jgi:hypothetical protein
VVIAAETPRLDPTGRYCFVRVDDSAFEAHCDDTRAPGGGARLVAERFALAADARYFYRPIAIGRVEPLLIWVAPNDPERSWRRVLFDSAGPARC